MIALSPELEKEREEVFAEIRSAFLKVTREGGVSWTEAKVIDAYGTDEECARARASDKDEHWLDLVNNPSFDPSISTRFIFMDDIGKRYHLPAVMYRALIEGHGEGILMQLAERKPVMGDPTFAQAEWGFLDARQRAAVRSFLLLMFSICLEGYAELGYANEDLCSGWKLALDYWSSIE